MEESVDDATDAGKCARVGIEAKLPSGKLVAKVNVVSSLTGKELQDKLEQHVGEGERIQGILFNSTVVGSKTLADVGISDADTAHVVNVVIGARPTLYMFNPSSAANLAQSLVDFNVFANLSLFPVFKETIQFGPMDRAPSGAKEVAGSLQSVLQSSLGKMFPSPCGGFFDGHVVVLTGISTESAAQVKQSVCEALGVSIEDVFGDEQEFLETLTFQDEDWSNPDECCFVDPGIDEETMASAKAAQKIMVNKLKKHFLFELLDAGDPNSKDFPCNMLQVLPQIHGGFDSDGNVVGILRSGPSKGSTEPPSSPDSSGVQHPSRDPV